MPFYKHQNGAFYTQGLRANSRADPRSARPTRNPCWPIVGWLKCGLIKASDLITLIRICLTSFFVFLNTRKNLKKSWKKLENLEKQKKNISEKKDLKVHYFSIQWSRSSLNLIPAIFDKSHLVQTGSSTFYFNIYLCISCIYYRYYLNDK